MTWTSAADFTELWFNGFTHGECREVLEAASGYKASRLLITRYKAAVLTEWASDRGLRTALSDFDVIESGTLENKGHWINMGRRAPAGHGLCFVYLGHRLRDVRAACASDASGEDAGLLADLFRIPECCLRFYELHAERARMEFDNDYAVVTTEATTATGPYPWYNNYLAQYFGHSLIHHFPCRWDCEASQSRALYSLNLIADVSASWARLTEAKCRGTVWFSPRDGVHMVQGHLISRGDDYRADEVVSTVHSDLTYALKLGADRSTWDPAATDRPPGVPKDAVRLEFD
ncbi:hypothetical protein ACFWAN_53650 [Streptomyces mirabilis]|uniref:hypothetical protein n=1 Tax=Streptomyces mirabilis TaxID=68239 RepID=UPI0036598264